MARWGVMILNTAHVVLPTIQNDIHKSRSQFGTHVYSLQSKPDYTPNICDYI